MLRIETLSVYKEEIWVFPKIRVPQNAWFIMENPIKVDDLVVPLFSQTSIYFDYFDCYLFDKYSFKSLINTTSDL